MRAGAGRLLGGDGAGDQPCVAAVHHQRDAVRRQSHWRPRRPCRSRGDVAQHARHGRHRADRAFQHGARRQRHRHGLPDPHARVAFDGAGRGGGGLVTDCQPSVGVPMRVMEPGAAVATAPTWRHSAVTVISPRRDGDAGGQLPLHAIAVQRHAAGDGGRSAHDAQIDRRARGHAARQAVDLDVAGQRLARGRGRRESVVDLDGRGVGVVDHREHGQQWPSWLSASRCPRRRCCGTGP